MARKLVLISYRHESPNHAKLVAELSDELKKSLADSNWDIAFDQYYDKQRQEGTAGRFDGWGKWSRDQAVRADHVIIIASKGWFLAYDKPEDNDATLGAACEASIVLDRFYENKRDCSFLSIVYFSDEEKKAIPADLTRCIRIDGRKKDRVEKLLNSFGQACPINSEAQSNPDFQNASLPNIPRKSLQDTPRAAKEYSAAGSTLVFLGLLLIHIGFVGGWIYKVWNYGGSLRSTAGAYADLAFCLRYYPHLSVYPVLFGWPVLFCLWQATTILWEYGLKYWVAGAAAASFLVACLGVYGDASGDYMMLHEFKPEVQASGTVRGEKLVDSQPYSVVQNQIALFKNDKKQALARQESIRLLFSYENTWGKLSDWESSARPFYLLIVFYIIFLLVYAVALTAPTWAMMKALDASDPHNHSQRFAFYLLMAMVALLIWVPFRIYYNVTLKDPLFGLESVNDNILGKALCIPSLGITPSEFLPCSLLFVFLYSIIGPCLLPRGDRSARLRYVFGGALVILLGAGYLASKAPEIFCDLVGIGAKPIGMLARSLLLGVYIVVSYGQVNLQVAPLPAEE